MDLDESILKNEEKVSFSLRSLYRRRGYAQYRMSKFEEYELYVNNKDFLVSPDIITFTDIDGRLLALKPDVTLSIVRGARLRPGELMKVYYDENVYRVSRNARGFREIRQVGLECIGELDDYCIGEVLLLAAESLCRISEENTLAISHLGIVGDMLDALGLDGQTRREALRCIGEKNLHELASACREAGVDEAGAGRLRELVSSYGAPEAVLPKLEALGCGEEHVAQLRALCSLLRSSGFGEHVTLDFSVLSDMRYYNGLTFKGYVRGVPAGVISGGQYDRLLARMGKHGRAVGFACYLDMLERLTPPAPAADADTVLLYGEGEDPLRVAAAVQELSAGGRSVLALRALPEGLPHGQCFRLSESGVCFDA